MTFTEAEFTAAMREAVEERGRGYRYPVDNPDYKRKVANFVSGCRYRTRYSHKPACLIGVALSKVAPEYKPREGHDAGQEIARALGTDIVPEFARSATAAQQYQDSGHTWGIALDHYLSGLQVGE